MVITVIDAGNRLVHHDGFWCPRKIADFVGDEEGMERASPLRRWGRSLAEFLPTRAIEQTAQFVAHSIDTDILPPCLAAELRQPGKGRPPARYNPGEAAPVRPTTDHNPVPLYKKPPIFFTISLNIVTGKARKRNAGRGGIGRPDMNWRFESPNTGRIGTPSSCTSSQAF